MDIYIPTSAEEYLEILFKRKKIFIAFFLTAVSASIICFPYLPRLYRASSLILVENDDFADSLFKEKPNRPDMERKFKTISAIILSWPNLSHVVKEAGLDQGLKSQEEIDDRVAGLQKRIDIKMVSDDLIRISYENQNPALTQRVVESLSKNLLDYRAQTQKEDAAQSVSFIAEQLRIYKDNLRSSEQSFYQNKAKTDLAEAVKKREILADQLQQLGRTIAKGTARAEVSTKQSLGAELEQTRALLNQALVDARVGSPIVEELTKKVADLEKRLRWESRNVASGDVSSPDPLYQSTLLQIKELNLQIDTLEKNLAQISAGKYNRSMSEQDLRAMERDKQVNEDIYKSLLSRLENAQMSKRLGETGQKGSFRVIESARLPTAPIKPEATRVLGAGILLGLGLGTLAVFLRERFDTSFRGIKDAKEYLKTPLLAAIPEMSIQDMETEFPIIEEDTARKKRSFLPSKNGVAAIEFPYIARANKGMGVSPSVVCFHDPASIPAEQYRLLRAHLRYMNWEKPIKTLLLTSSVKGEGKTTCAANLAAAMASEAAQKVLLMDCDIRQGQVAEVFGLAPNSLGLSDILAGRCDVTSALRQSKVDRLTLLPKGRSTNDSTQLLSSDKMASVMSALSAEFDTVIMDGPPAFGLADATILVPHASSVLMVVKCGGISRTIVRETLSLLQDIHHAKIVGFALTHVQTSVPSYLQPYLASSYFQGYYSAAEYSKITA